MPFVLKTATPSPVFFSLSGWQTRQADALQFATTAAAKEYAERFEVPNVVPDKVADVLLPGQTTYDPFGLRR